MNAVAEPQSTSLSAKSVAWDKIGKLFWQLGRKTAKPSPTEIGLFLDSAPGNRVCIVGASTRDLAEAALDRGFDLVVLDFSPVMCRDLRQEFAGQKLRVEQGDIQAPPAHLLEEGFDLVVSDRLVNRFDLLSAPACIRGHLDLLRPGGEARLSVKLGLYDMDALIIDEAERQGLSDQIFDAEKQTIDYSQARSVLQNVPVSHGDIPREALIEWYVGRGREARFERLQLEQIAGTVCKDKADPMPTIEFPDAPGTVLISAKSKA
jgi:SAM-dependent methyltransferase